MTEIKPNKIMGTVSMKHTSYLPHNTCTSLNVSKNHLCNESIFKY